MTKAGSEAIHLRRAALALHTLAEPDRRWLLQQLEDGERALLEPLIAELHALGIPSDGAVPDAMFLDPVEASPLDTLDAAGIAALERLLQGEPPQVTASLLAARPWPWRSALLASLEPARLADVQRGSGSCANAAAMQAAVLQSVQRRLDEIGSDPRAQRRSLWQRLTQRRLRRSRP